MQDIRSFFSPRNAGGKSKRKRVDDDDRDDFQDSAKKRVRKKNKKGAIIFDSDSDSDTQVTEVKAKSSSRSNGSVQKPQDTTPPLAAKKKLTNAASFFGASPVQSSAKKVTNKTANQKISDGKKSRKLELEEHSDEDFTKTLEDLDNKNSSKSPRTTASKLADKVRQSRVLAPDTPEASPPRRSPRKRVRGDSTPTKKTKEIKKEKNNNSEVSRVQEVISSSPRRSSSRLQTPEESKVNEVKSKHEPAPSSKGDQTKKTPKREPLRGAKDTSKREPLRGAKDMSRVETSPPDTAEKKKGGGPGYRSYLEREGPRFLGQRELPEGEEGCLDGLAFVITGMLEYFGKDELKGLIESHGGFLRTSISKKTSYVVIGREPGEAKTQKAQDLKIKTIDEEGLYKLISTKPGKKKPKTASEPPKQQSNQKPSSSSSKPEPISTQTPKQEERFSWNANGQSQGTDSPGSQLDSQESLGRGNSQGAAQSVDRSAPPALQMWVDKYKPNNAKQIIGQQGDRSNAKKLARWLLRWHDNNFGANKAKARFNRDDGFAFKAALLSGPPGVGKTTTAQIVCKENGFTYYEMNASDARSKKTLQQCVSEYLGNTTIGDFFNGKSKVTSHHKHCLIMDEIDGMSGNEDRGGIQEVIQLIKGSHVPIICICNDRSHTKIRSLCNHCFDLRFQRPRLPQIKSAMMSVAFKEGVKIPPQVLENMIMASNQDVRQVLHNMSMWAAGLQRDSTEGAPGKEPEAVKKDLKMGPWDVLRQVFSSSEETKKMSFNDKVSLFFHDYSIAPLFVQENYPNVIPHEAKGDIKKHLDILSKTADSIANGDLVDRQIRSGMKWKLLPLQAVFASVLPGEYMRGHLGGMINFPGWLGKNSSRGKSHRLLQEIQTHMRMSAAVALQSVNQEYLPHMRGRLTQPLLSAGSDGVEDVVNFMNSYDLTREDFDNILELTQYTGMKEPMKSVPPKVKSAFTRTFNKSSHLSPYAVDLVPKGKTKKGPAVGFEDGTETEGATQEEEEEDDSALIEKLKAKSSSKGAASKKGKGPASGKEKGKGKGKGKK